MTDKSLELWITAVPIGEAPLWVREKWVGLALPLACGSSSPILFTTTSGVLTGPRTVLGYFVALVFGKLQRQAGYAVESRVAIELLENSSPEAASWWRHNAPHFLRAKRYFIFDQHAGYVREQQFKGPFLHAQITRWVDDDPQPGIVECRIVDRFGREWLFIEKSAVVTEADLSSASVYPQPGVIGCTIVSRGHDESKREIAEIDTEKPWGIESTEGVTRFHVFADQLVT